MIIIIIASLTFNLFVLIFSPTALVLGYLKFPFCSVVLY